MKPTPEQLEALFPYLLAFWATAALAALAFFAMNKNARLKRRTFIALSIIADILFICVIWAMDAAPVFLALCAAFLVFNTWHAIRFTRFCEKCAATNFQERQFQARTVCRKCSAPLEAG